MGASAGGGSVARMIELLMPASTAKVVPMTPKLSNGERDLAARHSRTRPLSASSGRNQLARAVAFGQREKVVLPLPVRVSSQIRGFVAIAADHADIHFLACGAVDRVIGFLFGLDAPDGFLACHPPVISRLADVRDVLMRAHPVWLVDAGNLEFLHAWPPSVATGAATVSPDRFRSFPA